MNEKPILFNAEMVNAILSGRKTQTRRIMKVQPENTHLGLRRIIESKNSSENGKYFWSQSDACGTKPRSKTFSCPLGHPGDQLWVRETFSLLGNEDGVCVDWQDNMVKSDEQAAARIYKASCEQKHGDYGLYSIPDSAYWKPDTTNMKYEGSWRPSIHMPRWASRINLLITGVRVERLQDISEQDARAEGCAYGKGNGEIDLAVRPENHFPTLWASIYGAESWQANPWVWVINFERMEAK
ncbi:phage-like protein [Yersinia mollaretii]|uniref:hypothetical protein n=1 Tax=Yersinia mollaretii TaxID=33060 RepID=UPI0005E07613|nr:hypothetical protein [Yersinia mollaretii]CQJ12422.1 phage-like protein [Yersinia mollaretii]